MCETKNMIERISTRQVRKMQRKLYFQSLKYQREVKLLIFI